MGRCDECSGDRTYQCRACVAELETRREETIAMCEQLSGEKADLTVKLAAAMGALKQCRPAFMLEDCARRNCRAQTEVVRIVMDATTDEPPASKRLRAIESAAEEVARMYSPVYPPNGTVLGRAVEGVVEAVRTKGGE